MAEHVTRIQERVEHLRREFEAAAREAPYPELIRIVHQPGWTTPAEAALALAAVDNLIAQVGAIRQANSAPLAGAREVGAPARA